MLGVAPTVSDAELRRAYHRLAQIHHPDHNADAELAAERFAEVQHAYDQALALRAPAAPVKPTGSSRRPWAEPWLDARIAAFERVLRAQRMAQERELQDEPSTPAATPAAMPRETPHATAARRPAAERRHSHRPPADWFVDGC